MNTHWLVILYSIVGLGTVFIWAVAGLVTWLDRTRVPAADEAARIREEMVRNFIFNDARWFSEDPATMRAIERLARGEYVDQVREDWRRARADEKSVIG